MEKMHFLLPGLRSASTGAALASGFQSLAQNAGVVGAAHACPRMKAPDIGQRGNGILRGNDDAGGHMIGAPYPQDS